MCCYKYILSYAVGVYVFIALSLSQDILNELSECQRAKSSCSLYADQNQRLTDLEERYKEMLWKFDNLEKQQVRYFPPAFSAKREKDGIYVAEIIKFEDVLLNQGNAYNSELGKFTAPVEGTYVFSWTIVTKHNYVARTELIVNDIVKTHGLTDASKTNANGTENDSALNTITLQLKRMPGTGPKFYNCVACNKRTKPKERRVINKEVKRYLANKLFVSVKVQDIICNRCKHKYYLAETKNTCSSTNETADPSYVPPSKPTRNPILSPPSVHLNIQSTPKSHSRCFICKKPGPKLIVVSSEARFQAFLEHNVLIPAGTRCCPVHLDDGTLKQDCLVNVKLADETFINRSAILQMLKQLRDMCITKQGIVDFNNIDDVDCKNLTSLTRSQFKDLFSHVSDKIKNTPSRSPRTTVGLYLLKLRSGLSNKLLATLFRISRSSIRRGIVAVTRAMMRSFVPLYLGLESTTREEIIRNHTRPLAKSIFQAHDDDLILVLDGTYIYIQKSNNFKFQRRTYSTYKGRPLVKPMVVVSTTGYFVTIVGPYFADGKNNDAAILNHMLQSNIDDIKNFLKEDDILVVDRGFRDSVSLLEDLGLRAEIPAFTSHGKKQMATEDANSSRLVTKIRWVVESANSRIKSWKYLDHVLPTNQIPYIGDYVRIVCAISNKYSPPLSAPVSLEGDLQLAEQMRRRSFELNSLKSFIEDNGLERKITIWKSVVECELDHFPRLNEDQLRDLTCGVYQLKLSSSYIQEHLDGDSDIHIHKDNENLIRVKIQSRHISSKKYILWIKFSESEINGWYCKCRAGSRVVGVCSHIASIIWYLSYARYKENKNFGIRDWGLHLSDAADIPEPIDMSDTGSEVSVVEE